jgi:hypothetical protein
MAASLFFLWAACQNRAMTSVIAITFWSFLGAAKESPATPKRVRASGGPQKDEPQPLEQPGFNAG